MIRNRLSQPYCKVQRMTQLRPVQGSAPFLQAAKARLGPAEPIGKNFISLANKIDYTQSIQVYSYRRQAMRGTLSGETESKT
jgi:hypothetical protein